MNIVMVSVDYKSAKIEGREKFSFTTNKVREAVRNIKATPLVRGVVLISTCNRTELYLSCEEECEINPVELLCREANVNHMDMPDIFNIKYNEDAINHVMEVACGLRSMILCEDQIITQVKTAAQIAREEKATDSILETLFRLAATCGKKAKTKVKVRAVPTSVADQAICMLEDKYGIKNKKILVIGNGEMGRICSSKLVEKGADVTVTLRTYKYGVNIVPFGCKTIPYDEREKIIPNMNMIISATASPHYTITKDMLKIINNDLILVDLAVPRDIDPEIEGKDFITCYNIDSLAKGEELNNVEAIKKIREIIQEEEEQFFKWYNIHLCQSQINGIKNVITKRVSGGLDIDYEDDLSFEILEKAVHKTIDICLRSIKDELTPEFLENMKYQMTKKQGDKR